MYLQGKNTEYLYRNNTHQNWILLTQPNLTMMWLWEKKNLQQPQNLSCKLKHRSFQPFEMMLSEKLSSTFLWWEGNFPREYEEHSKVPEQAYTVLKLCINDRWSPAEELPLLLLLSREVQIVRLSSRLPLFLPVPPTPGWAGNHQLSLALQSWLLGLRQGCRFPVRAAAPSSATQQKPFLQPRSEQKST